MLEEPSAITTASRFTCDESHFNAAGAKWKLFEPSRGDNATSVFITDGLTPEDVWTIGDTYAHRGDRLPVARGDVTPNDIKTVSLRLSVDDDPPRHALILGWPSEKEELRLRAMELARKARLFRREARP